MIFRIEPNEYDNILYGEPTNDIKNTNDIKADIKSHLNELDKIYDMLEDEPECQYVLGDIINLLYALDENVNL